MKAFVFLVAAALLSCAASQKPQQAAPQQIVGAIDRTPRDREMDSHRGDFPGRR
jgi:hypothetical protein